MIATREKTWPELCIEAMRLGIIEASKPREYRQPVFIETYPGEYEQFLKDAEAIADMLFNGEFDT